MTNAVAYIRRSSNRSEGSFTRQLELIERHAEAHNLTVVQVFCETGNGDRLLRNRPVLRQALAECMREDIEWLLVEDHDRVAKDLATVTTVVALLKACGVQLHACIMDDLAHVMQQEQP